MEDIPFDLDAAITEPERVRGKWNGRCPKTFYVTPERKFIIVEWAVESYPQVYPVEPRGTVNVFNLFVLAAPKPEPKVFWFNEYKKNPNARLLFTSRNDADDYGGPASTARRICVYKVTDPMDGSQPTAERIEV